MNLCRPTIIIMGSRGVVEFQRFNEVAGNVVNPGVGDGSRHPMRGSISPVAGSGHPTVDIEYGDMRSSARTASTRILVISGSRETVHRVGQGLLQTPDDFRLSL